MSRNKRKNTLAVAFYNVENLFDTVDNPMTLDNDFTPKGKKKWSKDRYKHKIKKISSILSLLGSQESKYTPAIIGLVEVENAKVLKDLIRHKNLINHNYNYIHFNSPDERGIDVALLYKNDLFTVLSSKSYPLDLNDSDGNIDYTRDLLVVKGVLNGDLVHVLVNHWPSRRDGELETKHKRIKAAKLVHEVIDNIKKNERVESKFIIMGDFNDDPSSESIKNYLVTDDFYNPMYTMHTKNNGTSTFYNEWHLFDQIIISNSFFNEESSLVFSKAKIFKKPWMRIYKGKFKGSPFRTYIGPWYEGGFSDHFPVYLTFNKKSLRK